MAFVQRDNGTIIAVYANAQPGYAEEEVAADDAELLAFLNPPPSGADVDLERERRIALPLTVAVPSAQSFQINMDGYSQRNLGGLASVGQYLVATQSAQTTAFRGYDDNTYTLTGADLVAMGLQVAQRIQAVYQKSWALKAMDPIPSDYTADSYWP